VAGRDHGRSPETLARAFLPPAPVHPEHIPWRLRPPPRRPRRPRSHPRRPRCLRSMHTYPKTRPRPPRPPAPTRLRRPRSPMPPRTHLHARSAFTRACRRSRSQSRPSSSALSACRHSRTGLGAPARKALPVVLALSGVYRDWHEQASNKKDGDAVANGGRGGRCAFRVFRRAHATKSLAVSRFRREADDGGQDITNTVPRSSLNELSQRRPSAPAFRSRPRWATSSTNPFVPPIVSLLATASATPATRMPRSSAT
jgi:hypothetical protein